MKIEVFVDADSVAREAAALSALAEEDVPLDKVHIIQVDERVPPAGHPDRNLTHLRESLLEHVPLPPKQIYAMPVESPDLEAVAKQYAAILANQDRALVLADRAAAKQTN